MEKKKPLEINDDQVEAIMNNEGLGIVIVALIPGSQAEKAGVKKGDHIVAVNDHPVHCLNDYVEGVKLDSENTRVSLIRAKSQFLEIDVPRGEREK